MTEILTAPGGRERNVVDKTANDSDKAFTVPAGKRWCVQALWCQLNNTATVGTRVLTVTITDGTDQVVVPEYVNGTASQNVGIRMDFGAPVARSTTVYSRYDSIGNNLNASVTMAQGALCLAAGSVIRMYDSAAIDAAADDLYCVLRYIEYEA